MDFTKWGESLLEMSANWPFILLTDYVPPYWTDYSCTSVYVVRDIVTSAVSICFLGGYSWLVRRNWDNRERDRDNQERICVYNKKTNKHRMIFYLP